MTRFTKYLEGPLKPQLQVEAPGPGPGTLRDGASPGLARAAAAGGGAKGGAYY